MTKRSEKRTKKTSRSGKVELISGYRKNVIREEIFSSDKEIIMNMIKSDFNNGTDNVAANNEERYLCIYDSRLALSLQERGNNV